MLYDAPRKLIVQVVVAELDAEGTLEGQLVHELDQVVALEKNIAVCAKDQIIGPACPCGGKECRLEWYFPVALD